MDDNEIRKILEDHEIRISRLETPHAPKVPKKIDEKSLPDRIFDLREGNFFSGESKTVEDVWNKLKDNYNCDKDRVKTALRRLLKRKLLRVSSKVIDGKIQKAYAW